MKNIKNKIISIGFMAILLVVFVANLVTPDAELSYTERRKLASFPKFDAELLTEGDLSGEFEEYALDQFILREPLRHVHAFTRYSLLLQKDNNGVFRLGDGLYKLEYPQNEKSPANMAKKLNNLYETYLSGMNVYYTIIPDKNYFVAEEHGYPALDYTALMGGLQENLREEFQYIDLMDTLELSDYYRTDTHWRQECLQEVLAALAKGMNFSEVPDIGNYERNEFHPFYGVYYGQSALAFQPETLVYLTNEVTEAAVAENHEDASFKGVYNTAKLSGMDAYDIYLSGATPLITVHSPLSRTEKELILFRDSFGSSIAPLLLEEYRTVTLVDTRYVVSSYLGDVIEFKDQDVLFLYNTMVLNNSDMLR
ncbi:MAG: hypothetical protein IJC67_06040 [Clostridia bacterium]|nr:hypothetical protein [Clostridia bacterium]